MQEALGLRMRLTSLLVLGDSDGLKLVIGTKVGNDGVRKFSAEGDGGREGSCGRESRRRW